MTLPAPQRARTTAERAARVVSRPVAVDHAAASRRPIRVALLATSVEFGGIERVVLNLVEYMGQDVEFVPIIFTRSDVEKTAFFDRLRALGVAYDPIYMDAVTPMAADAVNLVRLLRLLRNRTFDLIHSHGYRADIFALAMSKWFRVPLVSTCHGFTPNDARLRFYCSLDAFALRRFARVIAVSARMKDELIAYGVDEARIRVVINAVAEVPAEDRLTTRASARASLGMGDDDFVLGYVGRLSQEKGVAHLVDAFATVAAAHPNCRLLIVGDGPERAALEQQTRAHGLTSRVIFAGFQGDTRESYSAMDAFVLPSLTEGTPMALLEAMGYRLPVVASAVGGVPAVLADRENGILVEAGNVPQLAQAIGSLVAEVPLRESLAEAGVQAVRDRYGVDGWIQRTREIYRETLEEGRRK